MSRRDKPFRLLALFLWASLVLSLQWAAYRHEEGVQADLFRDYRAQGRPTPAMRKAYRDVSRGSEASYTFSIVALTVAAGVTSAVIVFVPLRRKPPTFAETASA